MELNDDLLEQVSGGVEIGDAVNIRSDRIEYCAGCGRLLTNYDATITGVRGVLDGKTVYWVTRKCCSRKSSAIETCIAGVYPE